MAARCRLEVAGEGGASAGVGRGLGGEEGGEKAGVGRGRGGAVSSRGLSLLGSHTARKLVCRVFCE